MIDSKKQSIARITDKMIEEYGLVLKSVFREDEIEKLKQIDNMEKIYEYTSTRRDIDANHHVNNMVYLEFAYDAFPKDLILNFSNIEIYYKKQVRLGDTISAFYSNDNGIHTVAIKSKDEKTLHAILKFFN